MEDTPQNFEDLQFSNDQINFINRAKESYIDQIENLEDCSEPEKIFQYLATLDNINKENIDKLEVKPSCRKGCAHCCHITVGTTKREAELILDYMDKSGKKFTEDQLQRMSEQAKIPFLDTLTYTLSPFRKCAFLGDNNECTIYEVRPAACRNYYVMNPPEDCDTYNTTFTDGRTLVHFDINTVPPVLALMEFSQLKSLPQYILEVIDKK